MINNPVRRVITDSRSHAGDQAELFVALVTPLADGHEYIPELYADGVRYFLVSGDTDYRSLYPEATFYVVDDTMEALVRLAGDLRAEMDAEETVITGNCRKSATKENLYRRAGEGAYRSPRSYNSRQGISLSVIEAYINGNPTEMFTEVGIDGPGQAARLKDLIRPGRGVMTRITDLHDDAFESHQAKIREMAAVFEGCREIWYDTEDEAVEPVLRSMYPDAELKPLEQTECLASPHFRITKGARGEELIIDDFAPDIRSLRESLDFGRRHSRPNVLVIGAGVDADAAKALAPYYGVESVYVQGTEEIADYDRVLLFCVAQPEEYLPTGHNTALEVSLDALIANYNHYRALVSGRPLVLMVKAGAYGLGAVEVARTLENMGHPFFAVAVVEEGIALRKAGVKARIIVLNPVTNRIPDLVRYRLEPSVFSFEELDRIMPLGIPYHIKLDTGMHRVGFLEQDLPLLLERIAAGPCPYSVFTHLATADCLDMDDYTKGQIELFCRMADRFPAGVRRHYLNTAGMMRFADAPHYDMARLGIGLYGVSPVPGTTLAPVAAFRTEIVSLKHWTAGTPIGYGCKGRTERDAVIATVPVGYADGINRHLGRGNASFIVEGVPCKTIGNICMDQCMLDVTDVPDVRTGMSVEIFGPQQPPEVLADILDTIPYEILTSVSERVGRVYIK